MDAFVMYLYLARWRTKDVTNTSAISQALIERRDNTHDEGIASSFSIITSISFSFFFDLAHERIRRTTGAVQTVRRTRTRDYGSHRVIIDFDQKVVLEEYVPDDREKKKNKNEINDEANAVREGLNERRKKNTR